MSLLDFLFGKAECPYCGTKGARKSGGAIRCPNPHCPNFDPDLAGEYSPTTPEWTSKGSFAIGSPVKVRYRNYQGQQKTFTGDAASTRRRGNHISLRVAPKGVRITLSRDRIENLQEVESTLPQSVAPGQEGPSPRERQVLAYHKKRGTRSALYEQIRAKYPNW